MCVCVCVAVVDRFYIALLSALKQTNCSFVARARVCVCVGGGEGGVRSCVRACVCACVRACVPDVRACVVCESSLNTRCVWFVYLCFMPYENVS